MSEQGNRGVIRVGDVMQDHFDIIDGLVTVDEAIREMKRTGGRAIIVARRHEDDEYGIVLLSDIAKKVLGQDRSPERVNVYEIMTKPLISVRPEMDIRYCVRLFEKFGLAIAPVMREREVVGMVRYDDMVLQGMV